ncbi:malonate-semialdehyde dehydrogenase (acetylating)/methylmalonate-semialdehyde dehydrogenase [Pseudoclavibacter sp. JAI123]|uniref:CoA-acylating methylmalonate-semialdehyde dehydrogenase n=1 Tax=Pseudoclavibacter sp. JAI123 TaxID=2723065 RepID=UPI0015CA14B6|nr:CoA-acylating methylmalonate-semialdehyde dehydrogenase [Pseudoclavibacter sp. JAI123]NYF14439.1 malonate-semialdehyde dehydrogenase (acetylating)/methylmalonate-semialdehyde dehydrogenase [Pseudoclavibacter sp. JAI123]
MTDTALPTIRHWIDGAYSTTAPARTSPVFNPALGTATGNVALADDAEINAAIAAAKAAFPGWSNTSIAKRQNIIFKFRELLNERKLELAKIITSEHGKVVSDAAGEIQRGLEVVELATGFPHIMKGDFTENASTGVDVFSIKQALGVVGIISPFNFPAMVPMWFFPIAIAVGNTVVLKPSEKDPSAALWLAELWKEAGLPDGVFNVLHGDKQAVDGLLNHDDVAAISFVGSTPIAQYIYETASKNGKRVQALGGAKNHMLVLPDADLDLVADQAINAGYGSAGERCMAISVVLAIEPVADQLIEKVKERIAKLRIGDGTPTDTHTEPDMGPIVSEVHRDKIASYIQIAKDDGADVLVDGREIKAEGADGGFWLGPTLIDNLPTTSRAYTEEIFGPVLGIVRVKSFEEGVELINTGQFGNGTAIFTNDGGAARRFQNEIQVGMIGINVPIPVPVAYYSFGGWKDSAFGDSKAYGLQGFHFYTREKAVTSRWLDPAKHGGINLGFPEND